FLYIWLYHAVSHVLVFFPQLCRTLSVFFFFSLIPPPPRPTLFPYTTLFRSVPAYAMAKLRGLADRHAEAMQIAVSSGVTIAMGTDRKSTRLNSSHVEISYAVFCLKKKKKEKQ